MGKIKQLVISILINILLFGVASGQSDTSWTTRYDTISRRLRTLEKSIPGLNEKITNSVTGVPINEFLRAIAISSNVNISIDPKLNFQVINNFNNVKVSDILLFLCNEYKFEILSIGNIIVIKQIDKPSALTKSIVHYDPTLGNLSLQVIDEELGVVAQKIIDATGINVILANGLSGQKIKTYIQNMAVANALDKLAYSNNLILKSTDDGAFLLEKRLPEKPENSPPKSEVTSAISKIDKDGSYKLIANLLGKDSLSLYADKAPISEVLKEISFKSGNDYIMSSIPKGEVSL
jgi:type IV pilus assembly protein PilQ